MDTRPTPPAVLDGLDPDLIDKYCAGTCLPAELRQVDSWLAGDPARKAALIGLRRGLVNPVYPAMASGREMETRVVDAIGAGLGTVGKQEGFSGRRGAALIPRGGVRGARTGLGTWALRAGSVGLRSQTSPKFAYFHDYTRGWIAAVCVVMLLVFTGLGVRHSSRDLGVTRTVVTRSGEQRQLELQDGTQVLLGPNSTLRLANFGSSSRTVTVHGEAYFDVPHASGAAFIVRTGDATVRVLGTAFLVNSRHDGRHSHVAVFNGRVSMAGTSHSAAILSRGQVGDVADSTIRVSETNDLTPGIELRHGNFIFHDTPLVRVLQTLTRWYGYEFRCNDSTLMHRVVNVPLSQRSSAAAVSTLQELLGVTSTVVGDTITLIAQPAARKHAPAQTRPYDIFVPTREVGR